MKVFLYEILTQLIIWLGNLRQYITDNSVRQQRTDRTFYCSNYDRWSCCDCGLEHLTYPLPNEETKNPSHRFVPIRLKGYDYKLRLFCGKPSKFVDEEKK